MAMRHRRKSDHADLVPLDVDALRAAVAESGLRHTEIAKLAGVSQQRVSAAVDGKPGRKARRDFVDALAKALRVAPELLQGQPAALALAPDVMHGFEYRYSRRTELATQRVYTKMLAATMRDLGIKISDPPVGERAMLCRMVMRLLLECLKIHDWRRRLLVWDLHTSPDADTLRWTEPAPQRVPLDAIIAALQARGPIRPASRRQRPTAARIEAQLSGAVPGWIPTIDPDHERAVLGLVGAVEHILAPWFAGEAQLNYRALAQLTSLPRLFTANAAVTPPDPRSVEPSPGGSPADPR